VNFASDFCAVDECCSFGFVIHQMKLLGDHLCIMFHLRMQRKYGDRTICRFFIRVTGANSPVFEAPKTGLVVDVARLPFRHFFDSSRTNVIESQHHHCERARKD
jgi:hypothetical protein